MEYIKKINLLPQEYKDKYANKYIMLGFGGIVGIIILILLVTYINLGIANFSIQKIYKENTQYKTKLSQVSKLEEDITKNKGILSEYEKPYFPFYRFMQSVESYKPYGLTLISIDSLDRLAKFETGEGKTDIPKEAEKQKTQEGEQTTPPAIKYEKDLSGEKLVVRGISQNPSDIASFISSLSKLDYISDLELKAIEEHTINGIDKANVFEAILTIRR